MKLTTILKDIILEKKGDAYDSNCAMLYFNFPMIKTIHKLISKDDLYTEEGDRTYGLEDEPHVTLLYGIQADVPLEDVKNIIDEFTFYTGEIENASLFENENYDVLKFDFDEDSVNDLAMVNKALTKLPYKNDYPDYHPHVTIGYLKKGTGKKYTEKLKGMQFSFTPSHAVYSEANGTKTSIKINVD